MTPLSIAERSRRCAEIAEVLKGKVIKDIEVFMDDDGSIDIGEIVLTGGKGNTLVVLDRDEEAQFYTRIYRSGKGHVPETWKSWEEDRP
ncbi:MAG: hypothetical protein PHQ81_08165 [Methanofollis sp.]|nr:hypothetical protein [Methanofollis sp.]